MTDSENEIRFDPASKPGISNLITIYSISTGKTIEDVCKEFYGINYGEFKLAVGESVVKLFEPLQSRYNEIIKDKAYLDRIIKNNAEKANYIANKTLRKVEKKVGFPPIVRVITKGEKMFDTAINLINECEEE